MESVTVRIKDKKKTRFIKELLREFQYIEIVSEKKNRTETQIKRRIREGFKAIQLHEQGKIRLKSGKDILSM